MNEKHFFCKISIFAVEKNIASTQSWKKSSTFLLFFVGRKRKRQEKMMTGAAYYLLFLLIEIQRKSKHHKSRIVAYITSGENISRT